MRSEREPNRYEPLNETHRRVAEEEERRRQAEQEQERLAAQPGGGRYAPLHETHQRVAEEQEKRRITEQEQARSDNAQPEPEPFRPGTKLRPQRPETGPEHDPDSPEARLAAMQKELEEKVRLGRINSSEMIYQLRQLDNQLRVAMEEGRTPPPSQQHGLSGNSRDEMTAGAGHAEPEPPQRVEATHDQAIDRSSEKPSERVPESRVEREAQAAEYEITGRGEISDARAARLERLRGIDRDIERESRENEGKGPELDHDSGDHSR